MKKSRQNRTLLFNKRQPSKKIIYKFTDGILTHTFESVTKAAYLAGIDHSGLTSYIKGTKSKPKKIPSNVEYNFEPIMPEVIIKNKPEKKTNNHQPRIRK